MEPNLSQYIQNQLKQAQQLETQIEQVATQKYQLDLRIKEIDKTLKELQTIGAETPVYKSVGNILYRVEDKQKLVDDLSEQKELSEIRIKTLEKQQKTLEDKYKELETLIQQRYQEETQKRGTSQ
ncbi:MAG: prefoldin subunit beta [Thermoplasmatales archaeon A-plasma]|jgi:prefoldin beta subunit|nr:MAG: prefoldin subunit beta [Thermoplasmatales archaeon A-plasma]WMT44266.1 MAG: prefoldin subunit beta [Cuniculiplasma divulgatum]